MLKAFLLIAAAMCAASRGEALRLGQAGLRVIPAEVYLSRTLTVTVELEDDEGDGANNMETLLAPKPAQVVRLLTAEPPPSFGCTGERTTSGRWIYEAIAPGVVRFELVSSILSCTQNVSSKLEVVSGPATLKPVPVWSEVEVFPRHLAPRELVTLRLSLRNDAGEAVTFSAPRADAELRGAGRPLTRPVGEMSVDPSDAQREGRLALAPGRLVTVTWQFKALKPGQVKFRIIGAGLLIKSPPVMIRPAAQLEVAFDEPKVPSAVGQEFVFRGFLRHTGGVGVAEPFASVSWSPPAAARLISGLLSSTGILEPQDPRVKAHFVLELLKPGKLSLTVTAGGREVDTRKLVAAGPVTRMLAVQPPPKIDLSLSLESATVLVGSPAVFELVVANRSEAATQVAAPLIVIRRGRATQSPLAPRYQGIPPGGAVRFKGKLIPEEPGSMEFAARLTTRSDRGGEWVTFTSKPAKVLVVDQPRIEFFTLHDRVHAGVTASLRFLLRNALDAPVKINEVMMNLTSDAFDSLVRPQPSPVPLAIGSGDSATLSVQVPLPPAAQPYWVYGTLRVSGVLGPYSLPFTYQAGNRPLTLACPAQPGLTVVEPAPVFRPPLDPLLSIEWTLTVPGQAKLVLVTPEGRPVCTLLPLGAQKAGWHSVLWRGEDDSGRPVPSGKYVIRLSLRSDSGSAAADAVWQSERKLELIQP